MKTLVSLTISFLCAFALACGEPGSEMNCDDRCAWSFCRPDGEEFKCKPRTTGTRKEFQGVVGKMGASHLVMGGCDEPENANHRISVWVPDGSCPK